MSKPMLSIYVICAGPSTKIGVSVSPRQRLSDLQAANPHDVLRLGFTAQGDPTRIRKPERLCHARFAAKRLRSEWFSISEGEASEAVIAACNEAYDSP